MKLHTTTSYIKGEFQKDLPLRKESFTAEELGKMVDKLRILEHACQITVEDHEMYLRGDVPTNEGNINATLNNLREALNFTR